MEEGPQWRTTRYPSARPSSPAAIKKIPKDSNMSLCPGVGVFVFSSQQFSESKSSREWVDATRLQAFFVLRLILMAFSLIFDGIVRNLFVKEEKRRRTARERVSRHRERQKTHSSAHHLRMQEYNHIIIMHNFEKNVNIGLQGTAVFRMLQNSLIRYINIPELLWHNHRSTVAH
jgi:hypothetical protein